ncbi:MAG: response regulator [Bryobacterales bacterium]|nr:response regulator [Bryobacterales bacterium]
MKSTGKPVIVLVEDNPADVFLFEYALRAHEVGYQLTVFPDGQRAMDFVEQAHRGDVPRPDLFVLDLNLPIYSGLEVLRKIRESPRLQSCKAIILTTSNAPQDRDQATALGISLYLQKPTNLDAFAELGRRLKQALAGENGHSRSGPAG